jgi:hypothetical protein
MTVAKPSLPLCPRGERHHGIGAEATVIGAILICTSGKKTIISVT